MIIPIRCFTCGKPIAHLWDKFKAKIEAGEAADKALKELEVERYCCRAVFLGHTDLIEIVSKFKKA